MDNNPPIPKQFNRKVFTQNLALNDYFKESKVFFIFSQLDSISLESQMKNLNSIKNNNPTIHFIDPIKKISFIKALKIEKDFLKIKVSRKGDYFSDDFKLQFFGEKANLLLEKKYKFNKNNNELQINEKFPVEFINQIHLIKIFNENHAAAFYYLEILEKKYL